MRVTVDRELCVGSGACEVLAPDVFEVDDDGAVRVLQAEPDDEDAVRQAAQQCPTRALSLED
ncbi:ferredoxin [Geodermatophilus amargosae]|jgi:ferredoxin|uniref:Ferredoxin n=1 Tax=Geodermatophilus amargosae TaxID=1296565 RepID=A0A1I6XRZ1_9ACTN|nr:ferredoxin [Geodermatophilus amargosae]SFT41060.1 ferredoxin [Geodermatophilus amargosae]